ncbi:MAG: hypothetical protein WCE61_00555 [Candidatus Acidiferrum sp.]
MSAFIAYSTLEQQITASFERTRAAHPDHNVRRYTSFGGGDGVPSWKAIGFYARSSADSRLVCEAFHDEHRSAAVIRVFQEGTAEPLFARKWAGEDARFCEAVDRATDTFAQALPATPFPEEPADDMSWLPLSDEQRATIERALSPLPPPFSLAATKEA